MALRAHFYKKYIPRWSSFSFRLYSTGVYSTRMEKVTGNKLLWGCLLDRREGYSRERITAGGRVGILLDFQVRLNLVGAGKAQ